MSNSLRSIIDRQHHTDPRGDWNLHHIQLHVKNLTPCSFFFQFFSEYLTSNCASLPCWLKLCEERTHCNYIKRFIKPLMHQSTEVNHMLVLVPFPSSHLKSLSHFHLAATRSVYSQLGREGGYGSEGAPGVKGGCLQHASRLISDQAGVPPRSFDLGEIFALQPNAFFAGQEPQWEAKWLHAKRQEG